MRPRAILLVAFCALICDAGPRQLVADSPHQHFVGVGVIGPIPAGDTNCPVATNAIYGCINSPISVYVVFDKAKGKNRNCQYVTIYGDVDVDTCPGYRLVHVTQVKKPLVPPTPCEPRECTP